MGNFIPISFLLSFKLFLMTYACTYTPQVSRNPIQNVENCRERDCERNTYFTESADI